jgi:2-polyprenyl-3-methyl-5-hydroxy-6-metoxy-1,4-benzoquinol methylase
VWARHWTRRTAGVIVAFAGLGRLVRVHRSAQAADSASGEEHIARLRRCPADAIQGPPACLDVERRDGAVQLNLSPLGSAGRALVDPACLPVADQRADVVRAHGILESTLHADSVLAELRRVSRSGGTVEVDVGNAAAAREALRRGDLIGLVMRARAASGRAQLSGRHLLRTDDNGSMSLDIRVTHDELLALTRAAGIEPEPGAVRPPFHRALASRISLRGRATSSPGRPAQPWWPPLVPTGIPFEYFGPRPEVAALVPDDSCRVLDLGCAVGSLGSLLESRGMRVTGIELDPALAALASRTLTKVLTGDIVEILKAGEDLDPAGYDAVVAADCLEHLADPAEALRLAVQRLVPHGCVIVSLPNVRHWDTLWNLGVRGVWPQRQSGIHDRTHLRWFTRRSVVELLEDAGLHVEAVESVRRVRESRPSWLDHVAPMLRGWAGELVTLQWVARARAPAK